MLTPFLRLPELYIQKEYDPIPISPNGYSSIFNLHAGKAEEQQINVPLSVLNLYQENWLSSQQT